MILFINKKIYIIPALSFKGVEKMRDILDFRKSRKKADGYFRIFWLCAVFCILFCLTAAVTERYVMVFQICAGAAGICLVLALLFLCLAQSEGMEPCLAEVCEETGEEQMKELKDLLRREKGRLQKEKQRELC